MNPVASAPTGPPRLALVLFAALALSGAFSGCLLLAAGAGAGAGATWYYAAAREEVAADPRRVVAAAAAALSDLHIAVEKNAASAVDGEVSGRTARDDRVQVLVKSRPAGGSEISVRVGLIDDDAARQIMDAILARL